MRRLLFLIMLCMSAWVVQAQQDSTYHAFVEKGKTWCVHGFNKGDASHTVTDYYFSLDKEMIVFDGHKYFKMCSTTDNGEEIIVGFFREEDHCVFLYDQKADREYLDALTDATYDYVDGKKFQRYSKFWMKVRPARRWFLAVWRRLPMGVRNRLV